MVIHTDIDIDAFKKAGLAAYEKMGLLEVREMIYKGWANSTNLGS